MIRREPGRAPARSPINPSMAAAILLLTAIAPATSRAAFVVSIQSTTAVAGSSDDTLAVTLTNNGQSAVTVGGFAFELSAGSGITLTAVDIATTPAYIFAGHSAFGPDISVGSVVLPGPKLEAEDNYDVGGAGVSIAAGGTVGLGRVHFNVSGAASGPIAMTLMGFPFTNFSNASGVDITSSVGLSLANGTVTVTSNAAVPEPASVAMTAIGLTAALALTRRARRGAR